MTRFHPAPYWQNRVFSGVRIVVGLLLVYHGLEIFDREIMEKYFSWEVFQGTAGKPLVYAGKAAELLSGILLTLGWWTRLGAVLCIGTMSFITFIVGHGKFWYEDQHPFLLVLFGVLFFFMGPGVWSVDGRGAEGGVSGAGSQR